jgi:hypothetical protein
VIYGHRCTRCVVGRRASATPRNGLKLHRP